MSDLMPDPTPDDLSHADLSGVPEDKWPQTLAECHAAVVAAYRRDGQDEAEADRLAQVAIGAIAFQIGGKVVYFPRGDKMKIALRDAAIHAYWMRTDAAMEDIATKFGLTVPATYQVIAQQRKLYVRKNQGQLAL